MNRREFLRSFRDVAVAAAAVSVAPGLLLSTTSLPAGWVIQDQWVRRPGHLALWLYFVSVSHRKHGAFEWAGGLCDVDEYGQPAYREQIMEKGRYALERGLRKEGFI